VSVVKKPAKRYASEVGKDEWGIACDFAKETHGEWEQEITEDNGAFLWPWRTKHSRNERKEHMLLVIRILARYLPHRYASFKYVPLPDPLPGRSVVRPHVPTTACLFPKVLLDEVLKFVNARLSCRTSARVYGWITVMSGHTNPPTEFIHD
jgi:hypothetical protein